MKTTTTTILGKRRRPSPRHAQPRPLSSPFTPLSSPALPSVADALLLHASLLVDVIDNDHLAPDDDETTQARRDAFEIIALLSPKPLPSDPAHRSRPHKRKRIPFDHDAADHDDDEHPASPRRPHRLAKARRLRF